MNRKKILLSLLLSASTLLAVNKNALAVPYSELDCLNVLQGEVGAPGRAFVSGTIISAFDQASAEGTIRNVLNNNTLLPKLIIANTGDHATGLLIAQNAAGNNVAIYVDPLGNTIQPWINFYLEAAGVNAANIIDLQTQIQNDIDSCGPLTSQSLINLAQTAGVGNLNPAQLQGIVVALRGNAAAVRAAQAPYLQNYVVARAAQQLGVQAQIAEVAMGQGEQQLAQLIENNAAVATFAEAQPKVASNAAEELRDIIETIQDIQSFPNINAMVSRELFNVYQQKLQEIAAPVSESTTTDSLLASVHGLSAITSQRLTAIGVSAGDEEPVSYGIWVKGMLSQAKQKSYRAHPKYKLNQGGGTVGFDVGNDDYAVGLGWSPVRSTVKTQNSGKEKITSNIGSIYGMAKLENNIFATAQAQYGRSNIKKHRNIGDLAGSIASAKTKATIAGGRFGLGYDYYYAPARINIVPTLGLAYDNVAVKSYSETGAGVLSRLNVAKRTATKTSALGGVMLKYNTEINNLKLVPEIHANIDYILNSKNGSTKVTIVNGLDPVVTAGEKPARLGYNLGGSVSFLRANYLNAGIGYDLGLSKKFLAHTGYISLKVRF